VSALSNAAANSGGGGSSWSLEQGASSLIQALHVEGDPGPICVETHSVKLIAVQAVCLDDKAVPHPASQVSPDRDVAVGYQGEIFRCIAGARMQYTLGAFNGQPNFDRGQTVTCEKGMALYYGADGVLACKPQKPARDCNERSLLRRYGAGVKLIRAAAQTCVAPHREQTTDAGFNLTLDGGVGGLVR
jgi:hypothetical protein